jgi:protoporphyrin/coproporphyrin ferrochelatase
LKNMASRTAVILFNLGGPDSPVSIRPFLFNFFTDPSIIRLPFFLRWPLAAWIAWSRSRKEAGTAYGLIGGKSQLPENTQAQAAALADTLGDKYRVFVCMRYWHPLTPEIVAQVKHYAPDKIILLPLYPQYSTTTTRSSLRTWRRAARGAGLNAPVSLVCCYPNDPGFIAASVKRIRKVYDAALAETRAQDLPPPRLLFSAHGLPVSIIRDGDPYEWQCEQTVQAIVDHLELSGIDWALCYQSRVGRQQWLGPSTVLELERAGLEGRPVLVYPLAFTQEHVETLAEIEIEYRHLAKRLGVPLFYRVPTVSTDRDFIEGLATLVKNAESQTGICPPDGKRLCPANFNRCCMQEEKAGV